VAATGFGAGDRGLELISVNVTKNNDETAMVRQRGPVVSGPSPLRDPVVLMHGRMQFRFSYRDDDGRVLATWTNQERLPKAVAVEIFNTAGASVFPVPVLLKLPANLAAGCLTGGGDDGEGAVGCPGQQGRRPPGQPGQQPQQGRPGGQDGQ
jgi:hypothetical protein